MLSCIVIGAGPGGLVTTKELLEQGVDNIICLEKTAELGGVFNRAYDSLTLTSSCTYSMFSDFWMGDGKQHDFWSKQEVIAYWHAYAAAFGVFDKIQFDSEVIRVTLAKDDTWKILLKSGEILCSERVALAIGNNNIPSYPGWKSELVNTAVEVVHSQVYRNANPFAGKLVLVVGGGESGADIALEISRVAKSCCVSLRNSAGWILPRRRGDRASDIATHRGLYGLPRSYGQTLSRLITQKELSQHNTVHDTIARLNQMVKAKNGVWGIYGTKNISLPRAIAHHDCKVVGEIISVENGGKTLTTADGEVLQDVDAVVFSTGYKTYASFLPEDLSHSDPRSLYKHMFHPTYRDKIAWIGWARPSYGSQFPVMEMQARYFALVCTGEKQLPALSAMLQTIDADRDAMLTQFEHSAVRVRSLVDYHHYVDALAELIGCQPPLLKYFFLHPKLWLRLMYGATQASQFRLQGPGQKQVIAQKIIMKLPVSSFNHVVKAGLKGRLLYALRPILDFLDHCLRPLGHVASAFRFRGASVVRRGVEE